MNIPMRIAQRILPLTAVAAFILAGTAWAGQSGKSPVKVFILAGQSNMEGQGFIGGTQKRTLETLVKDPVSAARYQHLVANGGKWAMRDDVWCACGQKGKLTVGGLAQNWRPPSSGGEVGGWYKEMIRSVKEQLQNLRTDFPDYDGKGYEIAGFGWHQGWQDGCVQSMADEYEKNMVNFIRDVRKDFGAPKMPFVIGGSGFGGWQQKVARRLKISAAQKAAAQREEFKGNVLYVETRGFFRPREVSPNGFGYHWNCNAETYYLIGDGMGKAMVEVLGGPKAPAYQRDKQGSLAPRMS